MNEKPFDIHKALDDHPILYKGNVVRDWKFFSGAQTVVVEYIEKDGRPHIANFDRFGQKIGTNPEHKLTLGSKLRYGIYSTDLKEMYPRTYDTKEQALRDCGTNEIPIPIDIEA